MDRILQTFKEYDMEVLLAKKELVEKELEQNKELQDKLEKMRTRIEKAIEALRKTNYDSD
jgi:biotin operon repressor